METGKYKLDGHKVVPSDITRSIRNQYNIALEEVKSIIDDDIKQLRICAISLQYRELLSLCNVINRLTAELKSKSEQTEFVLGIPKNRQDGEEITRQAFKDAERIERYKKIEAAASKLAQCFPKYIKGEEQRFDIPRYVIDELEQALKEQP